MAEFTISLKAARINAELSQGEAAAKVGVSESTLANWEQGRHKIAYENLKMLSDVYNVPISLFRTS